MLEIKSLFINDEAARIEKTEDKVKFLICDDDVCMKEVNYKEFKEYLKNISSVCFESWNKDLHNKYIEFVDYFNKI
jgi:hypothetical protein